MQLEFLVEEQTIYALPTNSIPRRGSKEYLSLLFRFHAGWDKYTKTVYFQHGEYSEPIIIGDSGVVEVPAYFTSQDSFMLMLVGIDENEVCPTNVLCIALEDSGETWESVPPDTEIPAYQQLVKLAQQASSYAEQAMASAKEAADAADAAERNSKTPVARGISGDGIAYTATGDGLPTVSVANIDEQISAVGKGRQIVFVPYTENRSNAPTLQLNGGEIIPIRLRAPKKQGGSITSPDATQPIWIGALMRGVPYTMTFCGKYWLVDSQIALMDDERAEMADRMAGIAMSMAAKRSIGFPIVNGEALKYEENIVDRTAKAYISRAAAEAEKPPADGVVEIPTVNRVSELIASAIGDTGDKGETSLPVARASSGDGISYATTDADSGCTLPTVQTGGQSTHIGKGRQIVFIPYDQNRTNAPTLQLNGGEIIPIRLRAPKNQGSQEQMPDATLPVPVGSLMVGVPYTLTFCGKYWLVDSHIEATADIDGTWANVETIAPTKDADGSIDLENGSISMTLPIPKEMATVAYIDRLVPSPTAADVGKVLTASADGSAAWTAVTNAEEVAV